MARLVTDIICGLAESFLETLPSSEGEAGVFLSGFCWAFVLHWVILIAVTASYVGGHG
jgi:hypothetical protein